MEDTGRIRPSVCFEVEKVIGVSVGNGNVRNYQVQWAPTWISGLHLVGCEHLIDDFLQCEKGQFVDNEKTTGVTDANDSQNDLREDVLADDDDDELSFGKQSSKEFYEQVPVDINVNHRIEDQENNSCFHENMTVLETGSGNVRCNNSNGKTCTIDTYRSNEVNFDYDLVKTEDNDMMDGTTVCTSFIYTNLPSDNDYSTGIAYEEGDGTFSGQHGKPDLLEAQNEFQNNIFEVKREGIILEEESSETEESELVSNVNKDCADDENNVTEQTSLHTRKKRYVCIECNKTFSRKGNLTAHRYLHTGQKPYHCTECNKSFSLKHHLVDHLRIHAGEKPYKCTECDKAFSQKNNLNNHLRLHTGERPFICSECNKTFSQRSSLTRHLKLHKDEKS